MKKWKPKNGELVDVCYDGKSGRAVSGIVIAGRGFAIQVIFHRYDYPEQEVKMWFIRQGAQYFGGYLRAKDSIMYNFLGCPGDWYSVYPKEKK